MNSRIREHIQKPFCKEAFNSLRTPHKMDLDRRVSVCAFRRGSLTLEAALLLPFFLCAVTALLYLYTFTAVQARSERKLMERAQMAAVTAGQSMRSDPYIKLHTVNRASMPFSWLAFGNQAVGQSVEVRAWVGYTGEHLEDGAKEEMVYMTPEGSVYHRSGECTYLFLSIRAIAASGLEDARNLSGGRYAPCEYCVGNRHLPAAVYITDYGTSYHLKRDCQGLKRTVMLIPVSQTGGVPSCSRCGGYR